MGRRIATTRQVALTWEDIRRVEHAMDNLFNEKGEVLLYRIISDVSRKYVVRASLLAEGAPLSGGTRYTHKVKKTQSR